METYVAHALRAEGFDASEDGTGRQNIIPIDMRQASRGETMTNNRAEGSSGGAPGTGIGNPGDPSPTIASSHIPAIAFEARQSDVLIYGDASGPMDTGFPGPAVAFDMRGREGGSQFEGPHDTANIRAASGGSSRSYVAEHWAVRRLMPIECERLQGFPDGYTRIPMTKRGKKVGAVWAADGPRYKALGNSMAVNAMRWLGRRIEIVRTEIKSSR